MTDKPASRQFPANPSLESLRKEAKRSLKAVRLAGGNFTLADVQFQLARSYGFSSWRSLREEVERRRHGAVRPSTNIGASMPRRIVRGHWMLDSGRAEEVFSPLTALSMLALQPLAFALHLLR
jgi:hypothetical protein